MDCRALRLPLASVVLAGLRGWTLTPKCEHRGHSVAGGLVLPASSVVLPVARRTFEGFRSASTRVPCRTHDNNLHGLYLTFEALPESTEVVSLESRVSIAVQAPHRVAPLVIAPVTPV